MDVVALGLAKAYVKSFGDRAYRKRISARDMRHGSGGYAASAAGTIGAWSSSSAITSGVLAPSITTTNSISQLNRAFFAYTGGGNLQPWGGAFPQYNFVGAKWLTNNTVNGPYCVDFMYYGSGFEISDLGLAGYYWRITVDGVVLGSATTGTNNFYLPITFPDARVRRIRLESAGGPFGGIMVGPLDSVWKPQTGGLRVIVAGDSYTAGTGATYGAASGWVRAFANTLGLDDVWSCGIGGTGFVNPGSSVKMLDRIADVTSYAPDVVIWAMGHNDTGSTQTQVQTQAAACIAAVKAANPNAVQIAVCPLWAQGPSSFSSVLYGVRDGIAAAAAAAGIPFIDLLEMPLDATPLTTTLSTAVSSAGFATVTTVAPLPKGATIQVGAYPTGERRKVTAVSGSGPYTLAITPNLGNTYTVGTTVAEVGQPFFTGSGRVGTTAGNGNGDIFLGADNAHPTQAGHDALGVGLATQLARYVLSA